MEKTGFFPYDKGIFKMKFLHHTAIQQDTAKEEKWEN